MYFKVNGSAQFVGYTFNVVMNGSGEGHYNVSLGGYDVPGNAISVFVEITSVTSGTIGSPLIQEHSKITG